MNTTTATSINNKFLPHADKLKGSLYGMLVGDALAVPGHWFYSPTKLRKDYGEITGMTAPKPTHAESMVQGMSYSGSIDIMHDKAHFYEGNTLAKRAQEIKSEEQEEAMRDDHGNFVGKSADERVHYHQSLLKGQNTANACIARLCMRYLGESNAGSKDQYNPDEFLNRLYQYMITPPDTEDESQLLNHNDTYLDVYLRGFFTNASNGKPLRDCTRNQRDSWSIGSIDGVAMCIPMIVAYSYQPDWYVVGRAIEHAHLTHRSITVTACLSVLVPLLLELYRHNHPNNNDETTAAAATTTTTATRLRAAMDPLMEKMAPPKWTGREMRDSYVNNKGPGNIPRDIKWSQHMDLDTSETTKEFVHRMIEIDSNDEDVVGHGDQPNSRLSTLCYCEQAFTVVMYLAYKYADNPQQALLQNVMLGGHSTSRGAVLGAILGATYGCEGIPFQNDLCAKDAIDKEISDLVTNVASNTLR